MSRNFLVGIYFYPWYNEIRWHSHKRKFTPKIGTYSSIDPDVIDWQTDLIAEAGIDYVIIETVLHDDWCYPFIMDATEQTLEFLRRKNLSWSFMIDSYVAPDRNKIVEKINHLIKHLQSKMWCNEMQCGPDGNPLLFVFMPTPDESLQLTQRWISVFDLRFVAWFRHWGKPGPEDNFPVFQPFFKDWKEKKDVTLQTELVKLRYIPFWQKTYDIKNMGGFCSVLPGYDDLLLGRNPCFADIIDHRSGANYIEQFEMAIKQNPQHLLIYSWNEYFESTMIEPTREFGDKYVRLTKMLLGKS